MNKALVVLGLIIRLVKSATKFHTMSCKSYQSKMKQTKYWYRVHVLTVYQCCRDVSYFSEVKLDEGCVDLLKLTDVDRGPLLVGHSGKHRGLYIWYRGESRFNWFKPADKMKSTLFILLVLVVLGSALAGRRNKNRKPNIKD
ncbi:hypothetical protein KUTeg_017419 [Tegillarca granosa]|uniref:Uncharacterized protein n=1 Tax=Tegillarca granosa TaxID=220873 RepID=A0ABQ9EIB4_TEGGR|nr:hypothetical protein KUTeg_017419 [Tegillarca granosa]